LIMRQNMKKDRGGPDGKVSTYSFNKMLQTELDSQCRLSNSTISQYHQLVQHHSSRHRERCRTFYVEGDGRRGSCAVQGPNRAKVAFDGLWEGSALGGLLLGRSRDR
jgi:hypothetical protein